MLMLFYCGEVGGNGRHNSAVMSVFGAQRGVTCAPRRLGGSERRDSMAQVLAGGGSSLSVNLTTVKYVFQRKVKLRFLRYFVCLMRQQKQAL